MAGKHLYNTFDLDAVGSKGIRFSVAGSTFIDRVVCVWRFLLTGRFELRGRW